MKRIVFYCLIVAALLQSCEERKKVEKGVTFEMAVDRKYALSFVQYGLKLDIPNNAIDPITGRNYISFNYRQSDQRYLYLDFSATPDKLKKMIVNGRQEKIIFENEHIVIPVSLLKHDDNVIEIDFIAGDLSLNRNPDYLYTLFVPDRASTCFPSFDQPDIKASFSLELTVPPDWEVVSNQASLAPFEENEKKYYQFNLTQPLSTYQFAFAAGKFKKATDEETGMTMYYRETDSLKVAENLKDIFQQHKQSITWLEEYTNIKYPFLKFDFVLIPTFQYGGMEHPGSIFYRESSLILDKSASVNQRLRRASLIAHETAHMWFGNLVTMKWFNDVWLKEVFANFMAAKIVNPQFPDVNHDLRFLMAHYPSAYEIDRTAGTHPIQQDLDNLKNAGTLYGAVIYQKAPIMMRNLEALMGEENFKIGLQEYLKKYNYSNASWDDLIGMLGLQTDKDLSQWNTAWIKSSGMPTLTYELGSELQIKVANDTAGIVWPQTFQYQLIEGTASEVKDITISDKMGTTTPSAAPITTIIPNYKGRGYGYFEADQASREHMLNHVNANSDPEVRAGIWLNLWEYLLRGEINSQQIFEAMLKSLEQEKNPLILEYVTNQLVTLYWQFSTPENRELISQQLDDKLFELMALEKDESIKRTLFNCYKKVAMSETGKINLKKFWNGEVTLGLELSELDRIQLAYELAVRDVEGSKEILEKQWSNTKNPDRAAAMRFVIPALSSEVATRDRFFESLKDPKNREHEPWVLDALEYLHHPLRATESVKYIRPSLDMLQEIQLTGDIFFPKGWVDQTVSGYQSKEAAEVVRTFIAENPNLSSNLKNKLLQSADPLFRAEKILTKSTQNM